MKIYRLDYDVERFQSLLPVKDRVWDWPTTRFNGRPVGKKWKSFDVFALEPRLAEPDIFYFDPGAFIANERAVLGAATPLEMSGELLPVRCQKKCGEFVVYNVTHCIDVLDEAKVRYQYPNDPEDKGEIVKYAFHADRIGEHTLFKLADIPVDIFCLERSGDPEEEEFKALVEANGIKGITFELVWKNTKTPARRTRARKTR